MAQVKNVPNFTFGVSLKGNPVQKVTNSAVKVEVTIAAAKSVFPLTFAVVRTPGPIVKTQVTARKAATLVKTLACICAL